MTENSYVVRLLIQLLEFQHLYSFSETGTCSWSRAL